MHVPKNRFKTEEKRFKDIAVEWEQGMVKGFGSKEEAQRFIEQVCKKTAPSMDFSVSCCPDN